MCEMAITPVATEGKPVDNPVWACVRKVENLQPSRGVDIQSPQYPHPAAHLVWTHGLGSVWSLSFGYMRARQLKTQGKGCHWR